VDVVALASRTTSNGGQHNEVIEVPMQDPWHREMRHIFNLTAQGPCVEADIFSDLHNLFKVRAFQRHAIALPQGD